MFLLLACIALSKPGPLSLSAAVRAREGKNSQRPFAKLKLKGEHEVAHLVGNLVSHPAAQGSILGYAALFSYVWTSFTCVRAPFPHGTLFNIRLDGSGAFFSLAI